ncbi:ribonuclease P protein component [Candidatus Peregrinibacteria bacterium]|nr:ribonuclease P protein component [Candidatus Peregrinibacteria bacterium]
MLAKKNRLSKGQVEFLLRKGIRHKSSNFLVISKANKAGINRFCIIISKKLKLTPIKRTRIRRQIYEAIRKNLGAGQGAAIANAARPGATYDIALGPNSKILEKGFAEMENEIIYIFKNIFKWVKTS